MKHKKKNIFIISTPTQMVNALEFIYYYKLELEINTIVISCNYPNFISQIKEIGRLFSLEYYILFSPRLKLIKPQLFNRIPLKLFRLFVSKKRIHAFLKKKHVDRLILGNYSNFISQYFTQQISSEIYILDDGSGSIWVSEKRIAEIKEGIPLFDNNYYKKGLGIVKLLMGFYSYKISPKFTFFTSYTVDVISPDQYVFNAYNYLKSLYSCQTINVKLEYFIGSPISETGYVSEDSEIEMIINYAKQLKESKLLYIPHRLDSSNKINRLKQSVEILNFELPIEFALAQNTALPIKMGGFFTSALPILAKIMNNDVLLFSLKIPGHYYLTKKKEQRTFDIYKILSSINKIKLIEHNKNE